MSDTSLTPTDGRIEVYLEGGAEVLLENSDIEVSFQGDIIAEVVVESGDTELVIEEHTFELTGVGQQGPPGPEGPPGDRNVFIQDTFPVIDEPSFLIQTNAPEPGKFNLWVGIP